MLVLVLVLMLEPVVVMLVAAVLNVCAAVLVAEVTLTCVFLSLARATNFIDNRNEKFKVFILLY